MYMRFTARMSVYYAIGYYDYMQSHALYNMSYNINILVSYKH